MKKKDDNVSINICTRGPEGGRYSRWGEEFGRKMKS